MIKEERKNKYTNEKKNKGGQFPRNRKLVDIKKRKKRKLLFFGPI